MSGRTRFVLMALGVCLFTVAMLVGAAGRGAADTQPPTGPACPATGKSICVSIDDQAEASLTRPDSNHYLADDVTISNGGTTSNLVNITLTIKWQDLGGATTTSEYRSAFSDPRCTEVTGETRTITCTAPKSLGPGVDETFGPLVFRTANDVAEPGVDPSHFELTATATAKEQGVAKQGKNPPTATITTNNQTPYEAFDDMDVSWAGGDLINVTLATKVPASGQHSKLSIPAGSMKEADYSTLEEVACPAGSTTCLGQKIVIRATGIAPVNLQIFYTGPLPSGTTENSIAVTHNGVSFTRKCSGDFFTEPTDLSTAGACRRVSIDKSGPGDPRVIIDAWDTGNGDWTWR